MIHPGGRGPALSPAEAAALSFAAVLLAAGASCSFSSTQASSSSGSGGQGQSGSSGSSGTTTVVIQPCTGKCADFPSAPIVTGNAASNAASMFGGSGSAAAPCLTEPEDGSLFPNNWLRPRVKVSAPGATLLEIRFHADMEANDLLVYTAEDNWAMDNTIWKNLAAHVVNLPISVSVRALGSGGLTAAATATFTIAPVAAGGQMVYWALRGFDASKPDNEELFGFSVGDETVQSVLKVADVQQTSSGVSVGCIGCHTATPDGEFVGFTGNYPWPNALASVEGGSRGAMPGFLGAAGVTTLTEDWHGIITFSGQHWAAGDHIGITSQSSDAVDAHANLVWMEMDSGASGVLARTGDPAGAAAPNFSHDGTRVVYTSTNANQDGRMGVGTADLYTIPYADRAGGAATPVAGAADAAFAEYYPAFSPDDQLIAFNRLTQADASVTPTGEPYDGGMYLNPAAEVWVVPGAGGDAVRLRANDPPACTPAVKPNTRVYPDKTGWDNSWAKWSPEVGVAGDSHYYWLIFSSYRYDISPPRGQLYMTAVVRSEVRTDTYPAIYLWNQDLTTSNHTPAWDVFKLPHVD
jgi:hypothetical protein